jgi:hypothetical protein
MKLLIMQFSPTSCQHVHVLSKYSHRIQQINFRNAPHSDSRLSSVLTTQDGCNRVHITSVTCIWF